MAILDDAKAIERKCSEGTSLWIKLSTLQDLIAEVERLTEDLERHEIALLKERNNGKAAEVHGRPRVRSVGNDEG